VSAGSPGEELDLAGDSPWQLQAVNVVYQDDRLRVRRDMVVQPDGHSGTYTFIELPRPVVGIVPLTEDGDVYLVRQWRYPWNRNSWEIPAGHVEEGESPLVAAARELAEEASQRATEYVPLGTTHSSALVPVEAHLFLARGLSPDAGGVRDGGEYDMVIRRVPLRAALEACMDGTIVHAISLVALLKAARLLGYT
jgi:8-oxo-dGTP pyrophosphatase MutT (NUDIX family)